MIFLSPKIVLDCYCPLCRIYWQMDYEDPIKTYNLICFACKKRNVEISIRIGDEKAVKTNIDEFKFDIGYTISKER